MTSLTASATVRILAVMAGLVPAAQGAPSAMEKLGARVHASSEERGFEAAKAFDGDPATLWHSAFRPNAPGYPHWLQIDFPSPTTIHGFSALPRQDGQIS